MNMTGDHMGGDYQTDNTVTGYDANHLLAWQTAPADTDPPGWEWVWELQAEGSEATDVRLTYSWDNYGTFAVTASVDVADLAATRAAIAEALAALRDAPVSEDIIQRARQPQLEAWENALKTNRGWLALADRAQSEADRIDRHLRAKERLLGVTAADVQALARRYLTKDGAVEISVLPEGVDP